MSAVAVRAGTAEIELLLVIILLLLPLLFVIAGARVLMVNRLSSIFNAENDAYTQIESGSGLTAASAPVPVDANAAPAWPTRLAFADENKLVNPTSGGAIALKPVQVHDSAVFLDPSWHFSAFPTAGDQNVLEAWFTAYVEESHPASLTNALGLQPPGPP